MRTRWILSVLTLAIAAAPGGSALGSSMNVRVTRDAMASSYLRYNSLEPRRNDDRLQYRSAPTERANRGGRPERAAIVVAGSNDYCSRS